mgnify:CR=1 FL=1
MVSVAANIGFSMVGCTAFTIVYSTFCEVVSLVVLLLRCSIRGTLIPLTIASAISFHVEALGRESTMIGAGFGTVIKFLLVIS